MSVPDHIREELSAKIWGLADKLDWSRLPASAKSRHYESWTKDSEMGGVLVRFMPVGRVRLYLKDAVMKRYARERSRTGIDPLRLLGVEKETAVDQTFTKPHGLRLGDGRVVSWGKANAWKAVLMATFERAATVGASRPYAAVLTGAVGEFKQDKTRAMVRDAATRLGVEKLLWVEA